MKIKDSLILSCFHLLGYFSNAGDESGKLLIDTASRQQLRGTFLPSDAKRVPLLTVDNYCSENDIKVVDILKIVRIFPLYSYQC